MPATTTPTKPAEAWAVTVIEPSRGWVALRLGDLWPYRELLYFMVWRDLKVRYRQTALGALWAIVQPVGMTVVFTLFLGGLTGIAPEGVPYALFALSGLVPWNLFAQSLQRSSDSLLASSNLLQKVYFPRLLLPIASVGSTVVDFAIGLIVLLATMVVMGFIPGFSALWVLPLAGLAVSAAIAMGLWLAAVNVRYRDVRNAVPFAIQIWLFASPVVYSSEVVPESIRGLYYLNPMAGVIDGFRWALLGEGAPPVGPVLLGTAVTVATLIGGLAYFRRFERTFADVI